MKEIHDHAMAGLENDTL
jgi:hypothetical protein